MPSNSSSCKDEIMSTTNMMWQLQGIVEEATETLKKIRMSHEENKKVFEEGSSSSQIKTCPLESQKLTTFTFIVRLFNQILQEVAIKEANN
ncbi:hypothetical protein CU098_004886 [Rhizopus stolonifer]|uniref:Uncharacterized protein n=1 Tax=Rhizopus stolonifer TaxID=4846 RepID=A0A367IKK7_RHIST|nr:hypothetical protein CU098_004886 [Rhizopus stolonifer]